MEEQAKKIAELLKLLANEHRLLIYAHCSKGGLPSVRFINIRRTSPLPLCPST